MNTLNSVHNKYDSPGHKHNSVHNKYYGVPNGSKIAFWKGRYFFRDRDTSCGKGDTSSEIEILLVEREILLQRSRYFLRKVRYFFRNRDTSLEIEDTSCRDTFSCRGILQVCRGILQVCRGIL